MTDCPDCEYAEISTFGELMPEYVLGQPCPLHIPRGERYRLARREYVHSGDEAALAQMLEYVDLWEAP